MTQRSDAAMIELLAACEQLAESHARTRKVAQIVIDADLENRRLPSTVLESYQSQSIPRLPIFRSSAR